MWRGDLGMKRSLIHFLKFGPDTYQLYGKIPPRLRLYLHRLLGTRLNEFIWASRAISAGKDYSGAEGEPHRRALLERISAFSPLNSVLEIGCGTGLNLYLLSKRFPDARLEGIDINSGSVEHGNAFFKQQGIQNVKLTIGKADRLGFEDKSFDIVLTDAVLMYIGPDKIKEVVREMIRVTRKTMILNEWHSFEHDFDPLGSYVGHWARNYVTLLEEFIPQERISAVRHQNGLFINDENWQKWGAIIEVRR
jgi:SAM-dependent methyltransferase